MHIQDFASKRFLKQLRYPGMIVALGGMVLVTFMSATGFIGTQINRTFIAEPRAAALEIDATYYSIVAAKLGLPSLAAAAAPDTPLAEATSTPAEIPAEEPAPALNKQDIRIGVYNATNSTGIAAILKSRLEAAGFVGIKTGNEQLQEGNTIDIKESKRQYLPLMAEALGADFDLQTAGTLPEDASVDCALVIGTELSQ
jgi:hypothetical protein